MTVYKHPAFMLQFFKFPYFPSQIPFYEEICRSITNATSDEGKCNLLLGYESVYKLMFGMACFFFLMMILTIGIKNTKDCRAGIQNGCVLCYNGHIN